VHTTEKCVREEARAREGRCATRLCVRSEESAVCQFKHVRSRRDKRCEWKLGRAIAEKERRREEDRKGERNTARSRNSARRVDASRFVESEIEEDIGGLKLRGALSLHPDLASRRVSLQANCFSPDARLYRDPVGYQKRRNPSVRGRGREPALKSSRMLSDRAER